jgi:RNA polymerase sigma factor (sigma-70 family)
MPSGDTTRGQLSRVFVGGALVVASGPAITFPSSLSALLHSGTFGGLSDIELLERFASAHGERDDSAELAFATLVARHGPMVLRVCRSVLADRHECDDAFQATFLVLAMRVGSIRRRQSVGSWLHGVALRVAACARSRAARRRRHERRRAEMALHTTQADSQSPVVDDDRDRVLHEEISHLPERFRSALVLCYLEGLTHEMAADQLGCPVGTVRSRLATARERLRRRLTHRGVAPAMFPVGLPGSAVIPVADSAALSISLPVPLVNSTVRGALRVNLGKSALAGIVSVEAVTLMEGVLNNMVTSKLTLLTTTVLVAGLVATGAGVTAYSALGRGQGPANGPNPTLANPQEPEASPPTSQKPAPRSFGPPPEVREKLRRRSEESVQALLREYDAESVASRKLMQNAKTAEERKALQAQPRPNPASYAGALLYEAEENPGTPSAEEALIWIVTHLPYGSMAERAKEMIARDHIRSEKIEALFRPSQQNMTGSTATERLFREALAKNPSRKIQALASYYLARFLENQASFIRLGKMFDPAQLENMEFPIRKEGWGHNYTQRLYKLDPQDVEREAMQLYERLIKAFGEVPLPHPLPNPTEALLLPGRPTTYGEAAQLYLRELKDLGIGRPAPEIDGVDLDGRPMKLSDYRGRVVAIYFCMPNQLQAAWTDRPAPLTESIRGVAESHAKDSFALLGVTTVAPARNWDRETFRTSLKASGLPARFWWDIGQDGKPGPIQTAWNARMDLYVLDHRGVIRFKHVFQPELFEKAVAMLLKEQKDELGRSEKND